ncbi:histone H4 transcription factor [Aricia agestis]|uniref:histone H4 transcription factor n=1 Tax=Aricia agestis TaxID=91739 RepID=UPI001C20AAF1|nr:histone H4 transcription factor [Aricia agestis]
MEGSSEIVDNNDKLANNLKLVRCLDWLQKQNHPKKLAQQNKNDIQFIIETNAHRKKFLLSTAEDDATIPAGVDERPLQPKAVPNYRLRFDNLTMECEWQSCCQRYKDYMDFQEHVVSHVSEVKVVDMGEEVSYTCCWDICGYQSPNFNDIVRHVNYHSYHSRLLAIGFNARATLKLESCRRDSTKRNQLPPLKEDHACLWFECTHKFNSFQKYLDHVVAHINFIEKNFICAWAGCGMKFTRRALLNMHVRSHTGEKLIACYHCGRHFTSNHKLSTHLARQNAAQECGYQCSVCGKWYATDYLVREHSRQHVSYYACSLCDMSAPTRAAIAVHMRYRHLDDAVKNFECTECDYRTVIKCDLDKHMRTHNKKRKKGKAGASSDESTDDENPAKKVKKEVKKYACHLCPSKQTKIFSKGYRLTTHLVNVHGAQWPFGHSRFRYQISEDGIYRLTTTRIEDLEVSKKIVGGNSIPKESLEPKYEFNVKQIKATKYTPVQFEISLKGGKNIDEKEESANIKEEIMHEYDENEGNNFVEICMYDVDESGNIIRSETTIQEKNTIITT